MFILNVETIIIFIYLLNVLKKNQSSTIIKIFKTQLIVLNFNKFKKNSKII